MIVPRRSALYIPGDKPRALAKAATVASDCLIFDWEDAVAPAAKAAARDRVLAALSAQDFGHRERVIRVNGLDTPWGGEDVGAVAAADCDAVLFPKIESPEQVLGAAAALADAGARPSLPIWLMAETPRAVLDIDAIAGAHPAVSVIVMGTSDLAKALRARHTVGREAMLGALSQCVLAARAHGLDILDGVHLDLADDGGLAAACNQGRTLGFDGKTLIHPRQIAAANAAFGVSSQAFRDAVRLLEAWEESAARDQGVTVVNGRLVERLHADTARRTVALYQAVAARSDV